MDSENSKEHLSTYSFPSKEVSLNVITRIRNTWPSRIDGLRKLWKVIIYSGTRGINEDDPRRAICLGINLISLWIILINISIGTTFYIVTGKILIILGALIEAILVGGLIVLNYYRKYNAASFGFYVILNAATFYFCCVLGQTTNVDLMIVFLTGLIFFAFDKRIIQVLCIVVTLLVFKLIYINYDHPFIKSIEISKTIRDFMRWAALLVVIFLVILIFYLFEENRARYKSMHGSKKKTEKKLFREENENEYKDIFIQNAAHEARGAFYGVSSISSLLITTLNDPNGKPDLEKIHLLAENIFNACNNYKVLLNNVLQYEDYVDGKQINVINSPIAIVNLINRIVDLNSYLASEKKINIFLTISESSPEIIVSDEIKIIQIITNLLTNAIKFTSVNGIITINLDREKDFIKWIVTDNGVGMSEDIKGRIFDRYTTEINKNNPQGRGLGLHITQALVKALNGFITVWSEPGKGSIFTILLPLGVRKI